METTDEFAIFIHYQIPVVTKITSLVYRTLVERGYTYFTGTQMRCEELADSVAELVAYKELETPEL